MEIKKFELVSAKNLHKTLQTSQPFMEGFFSYREKIGEEDNPYKFGTPEYWSWRHGWYQAKKEDEGPIWRNKYIINGAILMVIAVLTAVSSLFPSSQFFSAVLIACYGVASMLLKNVFAVNIRAPTRSLYESEQKNDREKED